MEKIFIVEDDDKIRLELCTFLSRYQYNCEYTVDYGNVISIILKAKPDLLLLDINLPYFDGFHICQEIRRHSSMPIIIVSSRDSELDELMSMNLGADDYITKPYNTQILLAHITSVLRRTYHTAASEEVNYNGLSLNTSQCTVSYKEEQVELSKNEMRILQLLMRNNKTVIPRDEIMNELWQSDEFVDDNTLTVNINRLRKKLEAIGAKDYIVTKRGLGYMV